MPRAFWRFKLGPNDFLAINEVTDIPEPHIFRVGGHSKRLHVTDTDIVSMAIAPHLSGGRNGLNSHRSISEAAQYIRNALPDIAF